jgi:glycogen phosphorylase
VSTLDGWWDEAWQAAQAKGIFVGWAIGRGENYDNPDYQDQIEATALYDLLESEVVPAFYERSADGLPRRWIGYMKSSIGTLSYSFNTQRMVKDYAADSYVKAHERGQRLIACGAECARGVAGWLSRVERAWPNVGVEAVEGGGNGSVHVGDRITVRTRIRLGGLSSQDVLVELYLGRLNAAGDIVDATAIPMNSTGVAVQEGVHLFEAKDVPCGLSGRIGYTVRIRPAHSEEARSFLPGLIRWADERMVKASVA